MLKTFPFYTPEFDFKGSITHDVILQLIDNLTQNTSTGHGNNTKEDNGSKFEKPDLATEAVDVLALFSREIEKRLGSLSNTKVAETIKSILDAAINTDYKSRHLEIARDFNEAKNLVLQGVEPDATLIDRIKNAVLSEDEESIRNSVFLIPIYTLDLIAIRKYFQNINDKDMSSILKMSFNSIATIGMQHLASFIIENFIEKYDASYISALREYCQLFCLYVNILSETPRQEGTPKALPPIIALLKAAYYDGKISRERDFYTEVSLKAMGSIGTSLSMTSSPKKRDKEALYEGAENEMRLRYDKGFSQQHSDMVTIIMKDKKYENLSITRLRKIAQHIAEEHGCPVRGSKKQKLQS